MKILNSRPVVFVAAFVLLGVAAGALAYNNAALLFIGGAAIAVLGGVLGAVFRKKIILILALALCFGGALFVIDYRIGFSGDVKNTEVLFTARVREDKAGYTVVEGLYFDGEEYKGRAVIYKTGAESYNVGDNLSFFANAATLEWEITDSYSMSRYCRRIYYEITPTSAVRKTAGKLKFFEKAKLYMNGLILDNMPEEEAGLMIPLLFGDMNYIDDVDNTALKGIGLSHIFSVSGLHIAFLVTLALFIFKKARISPLVRLVLMCGILAVYGGVTGFPSGVKRAAVMSLVYLLSVIAARKNDPLNTLSLSALIIIVFNPRELFDLSFIMSVSAMLGLTCFYRPLCRFFTGRRYNKARVALAKSLAASISSNIFLIPVLLNVFNTFTVYMALGNLVVLPLVSAAYFSGMVVLIAALILPQIAPLFLVTSYPVTLIRILSKAIYSLPFAVINTRSLGAATVFYLLAAVVLTRFILLPKSKKLTAATALTAMGGMLFLVI